MGAKAVQLPKGSGVWYVSTCNRGERVVKKVGAGKEAKEDAEAIAREINKSIARDEFDLPKPEDRLSFEDYSTQWVEGYVENNLSWNTRRYYADMLARIPGTLKRRPLSEISREDVRKLAFGLREKGLARSTVTGLLRTISAVFNAAIEDGLFKGTNPALRPARILRANDGKEAEYSKGVDVLNTTEARHFLEVARKNFGERYPLYLAALRTAARQGELLALRWEDLDHRGGFVTIRGTAVNGEVGPTKNRRRRRVPMTPQLAKVLKDLRRRVGEVALAAGKSPSSYLFPSPTGGLMDPSKLRKEFKLVLAKAGLREVTFHSLRHTALTAMAEGGVSMAALQKLAGHSDIQVTARYYLHVEPEGHAGTLAALAALNWSAPPRDANQARIEAPRGKKKRSAAALQVAGSTG